MERKNLLPYGGNFCGRKIWRIHWKTYRQKKIWQIFSIPQNKVYNTYVAMLQNLSIILETSSVSNASQHAFYAIKH